MTPPQRRPVPLAIAVLGLGLAYAALYRLIEATAAFDTSIGSAFWPAAGVTIVVLLRRERRDWPVLVATVLAVETALDIHAGYGITVSIAMGVANSSEPLLAAVLLRRGGREAPDLTTRDGLVAFLLAAVIAGPALGALIGSGVPAAIGADPLMPRLPRWFVGDAIGVLVLAPALLLASSRHVGSQVLRPLTVLAVAALAVLGPWEAPAQAGLPFLVLPALALTAIRSGTVGATLGVMIVAIVVEATAVAGAGPFAHDGPFGGLVVVQMFLAMSSLTSLTVGVLVHDLVSRDELAASLRAQALYDSLTGLANRRLLFDRLDQAGRRARRHGTPLVLFYLDLDRFKTINDRLGHAAGDHVLKTTAQRLLAAVRAQDTVARIGGDEFVVLTEQLEDPTEINAIAQRLVEACRAPILWEGTPIDVGASVGVVSGADPGCSSDEFLAIADHAMYDAKQSGGGRSVVQRSADA